MGTLILCDLAIFDLKRELKLLEMTCDQVQTCLIFPLRWACFPIKIGRNAQGVHLFSMDFDDFLTIYLIFSLRVHFQWLKYLSVGTAYTCNWDEGIRCNSKIQKGDTVISQN